MEYSEIISERILMYCKNKSITVNKLATLSGMSQSTINNIMKSNAKNPTIRSLNQIAQGLDVTLSEFFNFSEMNDTVFTDE